MFDAESLVSRWQRGCPLGRTLENGDRVYPVRRERLQSNDDRRGSVLMKPTICINTRFATSRMEMKGKLNYTSISIKPWFTISIRPADFLPIPYPLRTSSNHNNPTMCHQTAPKHPSCGHAAHGTALQSSKFEICRKARSRNTRCTPSWKLVDVARPYCDHCIAHGEILAQSRGLDPGIYCQRWNVSYTELEEANPGVFPAAQHDLNNQSQTFPKQQDVKDGYPAAISRYAGKKCA